MRIVFLLLILLSGLMVFAQDLDLPDFRQKKDNFSHISDKDVRSDVSTFCLAGVDESVGKPALPQVPVVDYGPNFMKYANDHIQVIIKTGIFLSAKHKLMQQEGHLLRIDGKPYYGGIIGQPPHTTIESITVVVDKATVRIPSKAVFES